jgi:hypothetical protein
MSYVYNFPSSITTTGSTYTLANTAASSITWATTSNGSTELTPNSLEVLGNANFQGNTNFKGDVTIKGKSLKDSLDAIEERLAILHPNEELEEKWDQLRGLRKMYMELEAEIIEKEKMWSILKK